MVYILRDVQCAGYTLHNVYCALSVCIELVHEIYNVQNNNETKYFMKEQFIVLLFVEMYI